MKRNKKTTYSKPQKETKKNIQPNRKLQLITSLKLPFDFHQVRASNSLKSATKLDPTVNELVQKY